MKHNLLKSVIISVILLMGVSNVWGVERIYLKLNTWKTSDGGRYAAYLFNDNRNEYWQNMYETSIANVLACDIPADGITYNKVIFVRLNPSGSDSSNGGNNWTNKWNQSGDIALQKNELFTASAYWDSWTGTWSTITWYITGSFNEWKTNNSATSYTLNANTTYEFKVYSPQVGYFSNTGTMVRGNHSNWDMFANVGNCKLTTDIAGTYIFTYNGDKMNVTYPEDCYLPGTFNGWAENAASSLKSGSVTLNLAANTTYTFKIHNFGATSESWHGNTGTMTRANCTNWEMKEDADCKITTDFAGNYTFTYDRSTQKLSVTYPAAYTVTYGVGTNKGTASVTTSPNITSGSLALPSTSITFSKGATKEGYTWKGWYSNAAGTGTNFGNGTTYTSTNRKGDISVYACYDLITYNITYNLNGGTGATNTTYNVESATITLPTAPTKTGYTFAVWYDNANLTGNKVTQVAKGSTGNKTFYAKWTANQYTITWNANGGSVTPASSTYTYDGTPVELPTPTRTGYTFNGWFTASSGGSKISDVGNTNKPASNKTYYAQWTENTYTVNITANPAGAAKTLTSGPKQVGINPVNIATTTNIGYQFVNWTATDGITITNANAASTTIKATKAGTVTANFEEKPATTVYLKPNSNWESANARFAIYYWGTNDQNGWVDMAESGCNREYFKGEIPFGSHGFNFVRMNPNTSANNWDNKWDQTGDLNIPTDNQNCFTITDDNWDDVNVNIAEGNWKHATFTVTLEKTSYGKYSVTLNEKTYYSSQTEDVVIKNVPLESTLKLVSAESFNTAYNNNMCIQAHDGAAFEAIAIDANHTICGTTVIKENFSTRAAHTVYLRVSTTNSEINNNWNQNGYQNYIYCSDNITGIVTGTVSLTEGEIYKESGYNYYKFVIPAGCRTFRFERKTAGNVAATYLTESFTRYLPFEITNCYTIEGKYINDQNTFYGSWGMSLANGDYRLLYVEQVVEKGTGGDNWKTIITRKKAHPSDIIKKGTASQIVSLHVYKERKYTANAGSGQPYESSSNPEIILQKFSNGSWTNVERHMVLGPLETLPGMAMAPGKRNVAATAELVYDDGIEIIKQDTEAGRVWNFTVKQDANGVATLPLDGENLKPYTGNYYIRTDNSKGGWMDYTIPGNHIHFSQYAKDHSDFSHYFCKWVEKNITPNTKFVIANDNGVAISDTLSGDQFTDIHGNIQEDANIRWSWNMVTNEIARAYIQGAFGDGGAENNNILVSYTTDGSNTPEPKRLEDRGDWIYSIDVNNVKVGSTLKSITATYPKTNYTIDSKVINPTTQIFEQELPMLTGGESANTYTVRVLYDFKIDKTLVALVPNNYKAEIGIDVIIERVDQGEATQVQAPINAARTAEGSTVYAVMSFTKDHLTDANLSNEEKLTYWISFPFNVTLSDVFGFGEVGQYWMIKYYDGEERAQKGLLDDNTFWKYITKKSTVLEANKGYVLALNKKVMDPNSPIFTNTNKISLYFPSTQLIKEINTGYTQTTCTIPKYKSTLKNREIYDSNWNFIGVPSYADKNKTTTNDNVKYFYDYDHKSDSYTVAKNGGNKTFNSMFAYMVQFAGVIDWDSFTFTENGAQGLAAKKANAAYNQHNLRLELQQSGLKLDYTFIQLQDEEATEMFDMNSDLCKIINAGSNIYSIITTESTPIQVAGNVMPIQETIIPIGVVTSTAGSFTFAMPDGTDGITVELIDYETNTRTNLLLSDYTITLPKGTNETRFALHVKPNKVVTGTENIHTSSDRQIKKYIIDGALYLIKDGTIYDAQGRCVK